MIFRNLVRRPEPIYRFATEKSKGLFSDHYTKNTKQISKEYAKKINEMNKIFLGQKMNTDYLKVHKQQKIQDILKYPEMRGIKDLPFNTNYKGEKSENQLTTIGKYMLQKAKREQVEEKLKKMAFGYFSDLVKEERKIKMEPNFEKEARITMKYFQKKGKKIKQFQQNKEAEVLIKDVKVFKGIRINRNDNYSTDSYRKTQTDDGVYLYTLFETGIYDIPEPQWFSMKNILLRITFMCNPCKLTIKSEKDQTIYSDDFEHHEFVVEMNMKSPPRFSEYRLSQEEHIRKHEWQMQGLTMTNVDRTNGYFELTYSEQVKKSQLINGLL